MTADFELEQTYLRRKDRLHSSMLHGEGAVCGLKIESHPNKACAHRFVVLNPGLALDCCGNEIVVEDRTVIDLREMIEEGVGLENLLKKNADGTLVTTNVYIRAAYQECDTQLVPSLLDDCRCDEYNTEHNRVVEGYRIFANDQPPVSEAEDPLNARLEWQHTLAVRKPSAMAVDRNLMRLYVAEWDGAEAWLRVYDASNHRLLEQVSVGAQEPTSLARSNQGDLVFVAQAPASDAGLDGRIAIFDQNRLENDPENALRASLPLDQATIARRLEVSLLDDSLFVLTDTGRVLRWRSGPLREWVGGISDTAPDPETQDLNEDLGGDVNPNDMTIGPDGRWMVVAETGAGRLFALSLSQFGQGGSTNNRIKDFPMPAGDLPVAAEFSYDGDFLYILCAESQKLFRVSIRLADAEPELDSFIPGLSTDSLDQDRFSELILVDDLDLGSPPNAQPLDLVVTPRDNWAYILRREFSSNESIRNRGDILTVNIAGMNNYRGSITGDEAQALRRQAVSTSGSPLFQELALLGQRLYVAGETVDDFGIPVPRVEGSVSIIFINEGSCDAYIHETVEGCPECSDSAKGVVIASILGYVHNESILEEEGATNFIDNHTHRKLAPSTNTLLKVIQCMLDKGISEGIPGPRGPVGVEGIRGPGVVGLDVETLPPGVDATGELEPITADPEGDQTLKLGIPQGPQGVIGATGDRGPGIAEVSVTALDAGLEPLANLVAIVDDPNDDLRLELRLAPGAGITAVQAVAGPLAATLEPIDPTNPDGDQRLILTIPTGADGAEGSRGPGVTDVSLTIIDSEDPTVATANLTGIAGGDFRLDLELPRGAQGEPGDPAILQEFNHVVNSSWHLDELISRDSLANTTFQLDVEFQKPVLTRTLHERSAYVLARWLDNGFECECRVPVKVTPILAVTAKERMVRWQVGNWDKTSIRTSFSMIEPTESELAGDGDAKAIGVRLIPEDDPTWRVLTDKFDEDDLDISRLTVSVVLRGDWIMYEPELFNFTGVDLGSDSNPQNVSGELIDAFKQASEGTVSLSDEAIITFDNANKSWLVQNLPGGDVYIIRQETDNSFIVSAEPRALDGNNIWPGAPSRPSGNGTQGNDWISAFHIVRTQASAGSRTVTGITAITGGFTGFPDIPFVSDGSVGSAPSGGFTIKFRDDIAVDTGG
ncbi:MAG: hypothetical protein IIA92_04405 [Chloroflexi bacterium]|nr:hypothetical protein [Chloroflexota bacterium]